MILSDHQCWPRQRVTLGGLFNDPLTETMLEDNNVHVLVKNTLVSIHGARRSLTAQHGLGRKQIRIELSIKQRSRTTSETP